MPKLDSDYCCPLCQQPLLLHEQSYRCVNQHSFDRAKEGYVNLLPVQFKHSKQPGDSKAMVNARRQFLLQGYYQPLADCIIKLYQQYGNQAGKVLDAGCGEGFYTDQLKNPLNTVYGVDIAKEAIKMAAKKYSQCQFSVATLAKLPFDAASFDWLVSIYAPILEHEFTRVLSSQGYLLTVTPAEQHLSELKTLIYQSAKPHDVERQPIKNLSLVHQQTLSYPMTMNNAEDALNLLDMTPFAFKKSEQLMMQLAELETFTCQASFLIRLYQKP